MNSMDNDGVAAKDYELLALSAFLSIESEIKSCVLANPSEITSYRPDADDGSFLEDKFIEYSGKQQTCGKFCESFKKEKNDLEGKRNSKGKKFLALDMADKPNLSSFTDPVFGFRIVNPLISSLLLTERMSSRTAVSFNELSKLLVLQNMPNDWVIAGVILTKEIKNTSNTAKPFTVWKLSDLRGDIKTLSLLLFQNAHDELWKTSCGTCVAVLNPCFIEKKMLSDVASLSINSAKKVLLLGTSKDMGVCKAKKKNGERCKNFINISEGDFCSYHVENEYKKMTRPVQIQTFRCNDKYKKTLEKSKSSTSCSARKLLQRDKALMELLQTSTENISMSSRENSVIHCVSKHCTRRGAASNCETETNQRTKDLERLKSLRSKFNTSITPATESCIKFFDSEPNTSTKLKAIEILKKCPIEKVDPNSTRGTADGKRRALDKLNIDKNVKRRKSEEILNIKEIVETVSAHKDLIDVRQKEEENKYFSKLAKKEAMEEKMLNTFQLSCKAVICKICKYVAFSAAERCKDERHTIKIIDAVKRFFQCKDCGNRTTTLFKLPKLSCANCSSSRWQRCGMVRDRSKLNTSQELSIRGDEEKFLGGTSNTNINLLMPLE